tara:strand:+ start:82 stop:231 length:150 start_codon:yes stop_codon:yes gene_type:complete
MSKMAQHIIENEYELHQYNDLVSTEQSNPVVDSEEGKAQEFELIELEPF